VTRLYPGKQGTNPVFPLQREIEIDLDRSMDGLIGSGTGPARDVASADVMHRDRSAVESSAVQFGSGQLSPRSPPPALRSNLLGLGVSKLTKRIPNAISSARPAAVEGVLWGRALLRRR
jgi:hypothetical protein